MKENQHDKKPLPPTSALRFLEWFCPPKLYEGIEGDLLEQFQERSIDPLVNAEQVAVCGCEFSGSFVRK